MANSFKDRKFFIATSPTIAAQSAWDTALATSALTLRHPMESRNAPSQQVTREQTRDCTGEYVIFEELTSRLLRLQFGFYSGAALASHWLRQAMGGTDVDGNIARMTEDQPPVTSLVYGFEDGDDTIADLAKNVVVNSWAATGTRRGRVLFEIDLIMSGEIVSANAFDVPECLIDAGIKAKDCSLVIGGNTVTADLQEFRYEYNNNILTGDDPFPFDDIDAVRLERGDRTSELTATLFGSKSDTLYGVAAAETTAAASLVIGPANNRLTIVAPSTKVKLADSPLTFVGEASRSAYSIVGTPLKSATAGTPDHAVLDIS